MARPKYTRRPCTVCRAERDFKALDERDIKARTLMVCTSCNSKIPVAGQKNPTWAELLADDE
jgi:DNA-directed RNA polymerase subunit RPC12/RpoP